MWIFGPLPCPTISQVTVTLARAAASLVTVSPSTRSSAGRATVSPASPARRLTVNRSPTATLCWLPPAFTTAYTTHSSFASLVVQLSCPARTTASQTPVLDGSRSPARRHRSVRSRGGATRPAYLSRAPRVDLGPAAGSRRELASGGGSGVLAQAGGPAGRLAARRRRGRGRAATSGDCSAATGSAAGATGAGSGGASATTDAVSPGISSSAAAGSVHAS